MVAVLMLAPRVEALVARCLMLREDAQANVDRLLRAAQTTGALK
jgi:hypothetical protein